MNRIEKKFRELKSAGKKAFIVFITAGFPDLAVTEKLVVELADRGVDIIELGVPFSDPLADGPIIQEASRLALEKNTHLADILALVKRLRPVTQIPICLMTYYNPVFCFGEEKFCQEAADSGVDGVIIPDLPPEEAKVLIKQAKKESLSTVFFLAPTSTKERIKLIDKASSGFIYYVSLTGVTGMRKALPAGFNEQIRLIKKNTRKPVCVGFGVSSPEQVKKVQRIADGVIVGSAVVKKIMENIGKRDLIKKIGNFIVYLKSGVCHARESGHPGK